MTLDEFIKALLPGAKDAQDKYGIPVSVTIAQAIQESWTAKGPSGLAANYNNLFGIKGPGVTLQTTEEVNGVKVPRMASFRTYKSWADSIADRSAVLMNSKRADGSYRYRGLMGSDAETFSKGLQAGGYATDSGYASSLIKTIGTYNLTQFDSKGGGGSVADAGGFMSDFWDGIKFWFDPSKKISDIGAETGAHSGKDSKDASPADNGDLLYLIHGNSFVPDITIHKSFLLQIGLFAAGAVLLYIFLKNMAASPQTVVVGNG